MPNPYVNSRFERVPDDYYPTIDKRCVYGFLEHFPNPGYCVDPCAPNGSGIVDTLNECGIESVGYPDAFTDYCCDWLVCNPPYKRGLVDAVIQDGIDKVCAGKVRGAAYLLRSNFPYARVHDKLFQHAYYYGEIKLRFRPWWSDDRSKQPIHNFSWQIWKMEKDLDTPILMFADGIKTIETI